MSCGGALSPTCPSCGAENPPAAKFCIECGTGLGAGGAGVVAPPPGTAPQPPAPPGVATQPPQPAQPQALFGGQLPGVAAPAWGSPGAALPEERRKATVLFADLSGYTAIAERMDPEAVKSIVDRALQRLGQEVVRHGGRVDKYIGDNVMAVFGAPLSHEDDPERAVRAGLAMQAAMEEINTDIAGAAAEAAGANFLLRVGINSGEVLAGQVGDGYTVMGDAVNVAARLQAAATPGSVTVGEITHRLTRSAIEYSELQPLTLKGKSEPVPAWEATRVLDPGAAPRGARTEAPLVGRQDESDLLMSLFDRVGRESRPHLVTVIGQAGVGKSRLLRELAVQTSARADKVAFRVGRCPAYGAGLAYWALGEILRDQFELVDTDDSELAWAKLLTGVESVVSNAETDEPPVRIAATIARPLGIEPPAEHAMATGVHDVDDAQQTRDRLFSAVRSLVEAVSRQHPVVIALEDIHWADEGMLDLIEYLARWVRGPALIVCLARDELLDRRPGWGADGATRPRSRSSRCRRTRRASWSPPCSRTGTAPARTVTSSCHRWPSVRRATLCSRRRWSTGSARRDRRTSRRSPKPCMPCSRPVSTRFPHRSGASSSTLRSSGRPSGKARSSGSSRRRASTCTMPSPRFRRRTS